MTAIPDWNVVATVYPGEWRLARRLLGKLGPVERSGYYNVLLMRATDLQSFLEQLSALTRDHPEVLNSVSRISPAMQIFDFDSAEAFERKAREVVLGWLDALAGKSFFVRLHRRGRELGKSSQDEERFLDTAILGALAEAGCPGRISFEEPDVIIDIETVGNRAGLSLWTREDLQRWPLLGTR